MEETLYIYICIHTYTHYKLYAIFCHKWLVSAVKRSVAYHIFTQFHVNTMFSIYYMHKFPMFLVQGVG